MCLSIVLRFEPDGNWNCFPDDRHSVNWLSHCRTASVLILSAEPEKKSSKNSPSDWSFSYS